MSIKPLSLDSFLSDCKEKRVVSIVSEIFSGSESPVDVFDNLSQPNKEFGRVSRLSALMLAGSFCKITAGWFDGLR